MSDETPPPGEEPTPSAATLAKAEKLDPSGANADREERGAIIEDMNTADEAKAKADQEAADAAAAGGESEASQGVPEHVVKRDDAGAAEQQKAAQEAALPTALGALDGPPAVAPIIESQKLGKWKVLKGDGSGKEVKDMRQDLFDAWIYGTDFPIGEVIIDVRKEDGQDHQRFSTWSGDGTIHFSLNGILNSPGNWVIHLESPVTQVGEGRDDRLPVIREGKERKLVLR